MKSRDEFTTEESYKEYLRYYYTGLALQAIAGAESQNKQRTQLDNANYTANMCILFADQLIKALDIEND
jgi:hypothetical protein